MRFLGLLVILPMVVGAQMQVAAPGRVQGLVRASDTNGPISHVAVMLRPLMADGGVGRLIRGDSDEKGEFMFADVTPGAYMLTAERAGYGRVTYTEGTATFRSKQFMVRSGETNSIRLKLMPLGVVAGSVVGADGGPLAHARVMLGHYRVVEGARVLVPEREVSTDQSGAFRVSGVPAGQYLLSAFSRGERVYAPSYSPGVSSPAGAQPIQVEIGRTVDGLRLQLAEARGFGISGQVTDATGAAVAGATVVARRQAEDGVANLLSSESATVKSGSGGEFLLARLLPGKYRVTVTGGGGLMGSTMVDLAGQDLTGVRVMAGLGAMVSGRIVFEGNFPGEKKPVNPHLARISLRPDVAGEGFAHMPGVIADDATFRIGNVPEGPMRFNVGMSADRYYVKSIRWNGRDLTDQTVEVGKGDRVEGVEVVISLAAAQLSGRVVPEDGARGVAGAQVVILFPTQMDTPRTQQRLTKVARVNEAGQFTIRGIRPGEYAVVAVRNVAEGSEGDPSFQAAMQPQGRPVSVMVGRARSEILRAVDAPR